MDQETPKFRGPVRLWKTLAAVCATNMDWIALSLQPWSARRVQRSGCHESIKIGETREVDSPGLGRARPHRHQRRGDKGNDASEIAATHASRNHS